MYHLSKFCKVKKTLYNTYWKDILIGTKCKVFIIDETFKGMIPGIWVSCSEEPTIRNSVRIVFDDGKYTCWYNCFEAVFDRESLFKDSNEI